jgi:resuscitation-promoting factor RpfB
MVRRHPLASLAVAVAILAAGGHGVQTATAAPSSVPGNVTLGQHLAALRGWGTGPQWDCLDALWQRESGWSATATNPQSGAYGIAQSLHGDQGGTGGNEYSTSDSQGLTAGQLAAANDGGPGQQIRWGLAYIATTYGTPCAAWQHETDDGWY